MTKFLFTNNATGALASDITSLATSMDLGVGEGSLFPNPVSGEAFRATIQSGSDYEIVEVTARTSDTLTIVRAREGTSARAWSAGAAVDLRMTAEVLGSVRDGPDPVAAIGALTPIADRLPYFTSGSAAALAVFPAYGRSLVAAASASAARTVLELGNSGVTAGEYAYPTITVDVLGRVTAAAAKTPTQLAAYLTDDGQTFIPTNLSVTYGKVAAAALADAAAYRAKTASKLLTAEAPWDAAAFVALTYGASVALDLSTGLNFSLTLTGDAALANPTNAKVGQSGVIMVTQDATGGRTLSFGTSYKFASGVAPTVTTTAAAINLYSYFVISSTQIALTAIRGLA